jgi:hypothetical protein
MPLLFGRGSIPVRLSLPKYLVVTKSLSNHHLFIPTTTISTMSVEAQPPSTEIITLTRCVSGSYLLKLSTLTVCRVLSSHILSEQIRLGAAATGDLTLLLNAIGFASKFIASNVRRARLINLFVPPPPAPMPTSSQRSLTFIIRVGMAGDTNVQGEEQKKLDVLSNDIMVNSLRASGKTAVLISEEIEQAIIIEDKYKGKYCVVFDPLDGSSNIDAGVNVGTIFGIYQVVRNMVGSELRVRCAHLAFLASRIARYD